MSGGGSTSVFEEKAPDHRLPLGGMKIDNIIDGLQTFDVSHAGGEFQEVLGAGVSSEKQ